MISCANVILSHTGTPGGSNASIWPIFGRAFVTTFIKYRYGVPKLPRQSTLFVRLDVFGTSYPLWADGCRVLWLCRWIKWAYECKITYVGQ